MAKTRTGDFPIGFRNNIRHWQKDIEGAIRFAVDQGFELIDLGPCDAATADQVRGAGLAIGSVDLKHPWSDLTAADAAKRRDAADQAAQTIKDLVPHGTRNFFTVVIPEDPTAPRKQNLERAVDGYGRLCQAIESSGGRIVLEGWPGGHPHYAHLACTPEGYRLLIDQVGSKALGVNFDPSHLVRMGIDWVRFLDEFAARVYHVHAKDTELLDEGLYEYGNLQPATFGESRGYGGHHWRYCIPGHGAVRWERLLEMLRDTGYDGGLSIELEDENFVDTPQDQERGLLAARDFLVHV